MTILRLFKLRTFILLLVDVFESRFANDSVHSCERLSLMWPWIPSHEFVGNLKLGVFLCVVEELVDDGLLVVGLAAVEDFLDVDATASALFGVRRGRGGFGVSKIFDFVFLKFFLDLFDHTEGGIFFFFGFFLGIIGCFELCLESVVRLLALLYH